MSTFKTFKNKLSTSDLIRHKLRQEEADRLNKINENYEMIKKEDDISSKRSSIIETKYNREIANRESARFLVETKKRLLTKSMNILSENLFEEKDHIMESMIDRFIEEEGVGTILSNIKSKTYVLSEVSLIIEKTIEKYKDKIKEDKKNNTPTIIDPELEDDFSDEVKNIDIKKINDTIVDRVTQTIEDFIEKKAEEKEKVMDIIDSVQSKIDDSTSEDVAESYNIIGRKRITDVSNKKSYNLFESMVNSISKRAVKDSMYGEFLTEGKLNVEAVIDRATSIYTFLEFINTYKFKDIDEDYILKIHKEMK